MADVVRSALRRVQADFLAAATARFPRDGYSDWTFVWAHLRELTGIPNLPSLILASLQDGRLLYVSDSFRSQESDWTLPSTVTAPSWKLHELWQSVVYGANWLHELPDRRVLMYDPKERRNPFPLVLVAIRFDVLQRRDARMAVPSCAPTMSAAVLHDVLATLHGRDRRTADHVCVAWRRAVYDPLLPVTSDDVQTWVVPAFAAMERAYPEYRPAKDDVETAWAFTSLWLQGYND
jgi:hypothetical protein